MIPGNINTDLISGAEGAYQVERSLRFNSADSAYLSRTPASAGNRKTWTWSGWVKRSKLASNNGVLLASSSATWNNSNSLALSFIDTDQLYFYAYSTGYFQTQQLFRDTSAWYHIVFAFDSTQSVATDRAKLYVNGSLVTQYSYENRSAITQNADFGVNAAHEHRIGSRHYDASVLSDLYLADVHFIDGQALTPSSFAETNATTGQWVPKAYTGSYGTNGFKLSFSNNASTTTISQDSSGNNNHWTANNISVTAGAGNDSLVDTPTSYGTDTGAGGEVRGNYCTLNPLGGKATVTLANGNLERTGGANNKMGTFGMSSGKWYWEIVCNTLTGGAYNGITEYSNEPDAYSLNYMYSATGGKYVGTTPSAYGASYAVGDVVGFAYDADTGSLTCYKNGVSQGVLVSGLAGKTLFPVTRTDASAQMVCNFGQRPFAYTAPSGFKALCDTNLPAPVVAKPSTVFDTKLWTGNGSGQTISGLGFSPDFVWIKQRNAARHNWLFDAVRGAGLGLRSDTTNSENTNDVDGYLSAFTSDGFSYAAGSTSILNVGGNTGTYVGWAWDAGSSTVTNTQGSITSQVRANASAGFSIVTYTGNGVNNSSVGHGLGVAPRFVIIKNRTDAIDWIVYTTAVDGSLDYLFLNTTGAKGDALETLPSSSLFYVPGNTYAGANGKNYVAYCFAPVAGYSSFGSYVGNGTSGDGVFVYTGFRVRWLLIKQSSAAGEQWFLLDSARSPYNVAQEYLCPSASFGETSAYGIVDFLSNGFKLRATGSISSFNGSGATYIYCAFAESPLQYTRAR